MMYNNRMRKQLLTAGLILLFIFALLGAAGCAPAAVTPDPAPEPPAEPEPVEQPKTSGYILLATTTSTYDSGLLDYLVPVFTEETGIEVRILSRGTGAALELGQRGDADVLLVHDRDAELKLVEEGYFTDRYDSMYNDFILVGPAADPAGIGNIESVLEALQALAAGGYDFVSRGDDSGTHRMELRIWESAGIEPAGDWYHAVGAGMGETLRVADEKEGYTLTDRGTYVALRDTLDLEILLEGDILLFNQYGVMAVNPEKHPHVQYDRAIKFIEFIMSEKGQALVADYKVDGEVLFFPGYGLE